MDASPATLVSRPGARPAGVHRVPGDKSISHRALIIGALAAGETNISGLLEGTDCLATAAAVQQLGATVVRGDAGQWRVTGTGAHGLRAAGAVIDCGNSGTAARLLLGALAASPGRATLVGDASLSKRPMRRVASPLNRMGARLELASHGGLPVTVQGAARLTAFDERLEIASAQLKSALLLAGVVSGQAVRIASLAPSRDHTERMLRAFGVAVRSDGDCVTLARGAQPVATEVRVPGDLSSAAFLLAAAAAVPGAQLTVTEVGLNPTRSGVLDLLARFGAEVSVEVREVWGGEPVGQVSVTGRGLRGFAIPPALVPLSIDELPLIMVLAGLAAGPTTLSGASELRVKESDRIASVAAGLSALGVPVEIRADGLRVQGGGLSGGTVDSVGDHRIAMAFAVAAVAARDPVHIQGSQMIDTSFPGFVGLAAAAGLDLAVAA